MAAEQLALDLFAVPATPASAPARTWADVRSGERVTYDVPGSPWRGTWTVRRIEQHPLAHYLMIVTLMNGAGQVWETWFHRKVAVDREATDGR